MSLVIEIASSPATSQAYEHAIELAIALSDVEKDVVVWISGEAALAAMMLSQDENCIFVKKLKQLALLEIKCVVYAGLNLAAPLSFVEPQDGNQLRELISNSQKSVVF